MLRKLLLFLLLLNLSGFAFCQDTTGIQKALAKATRLVSSAKNDKHKAVLVMDTASIKQRKFDPAALRAYASQREFVYTGDYQGETWWQAFKRWLQELWDSFFSKGHRAKNFNGLLRYFLIIAGAAALGFLIFKLLGVNIANIFRNKPAAGDLPYSELIENIHEINFDEGIEQAVAKHNYRMAVRLLYLKSLKQLADAGLIHWEINKTNNDYSNELQNINQRVAFNLLTRQFEYVWYGNFAIDGPVYQKVSILFKDFKETIGK